MVLADVWNQVQDFAHFLTRHEAGCPVGAFAGENEVAFPVILPGISGPHLHNYQDEEAKTDQADAKTIKPIRHAEGGHQADKEIRVGEGG